MNQELCLARAKAARDRAPTRGRDARATTPARPSSWIVAGLTMAIRGWQLVVSPAQVFLFGATGGCRYTPSCSAYAVEALRGHGAVAGSALVARRVCRCHPWGGGGHDPVPPAQI